MSPHWQAGSLPVAPQRKPHMCPCLGCYKHCLLWMLGRIYPSELVSFRYWYMTRVRLLDQLLFSGQVVCNSLWRCGLQHARLRCPSLSPRVWPNSCSLNQWGHPATSSSVILFSFCLQFSQHQGFSSESALRITCSKYWSFSFSISPSNEYSGLSSFVTDWLGLLAVQRTLKRLFQPHSSKSSILLVLCLLYGPALTSIPGYWKYHILEYMDLCQQSDAFAFYFILFFTLFCFTILYWFLIHCLGLS